MPGDENVDFKGSWFTIARSFSPTGLAAAWFCIAVVGKPLCHEPPCPGEIQKPAWFTVSETKKPVVTQKPAWFTISSKPQGGLKPAWFTIARSVFPATPCVKPAWFTIGLEPQYGQKSAWFTVAMAQAPKTGFKPPWFSIWAPEPEDIPDYGMCHHWFAGYADPLPRNVLKLPWFVIYADPTETVVTLVEPPTDECYFWMPPWLGFDPIPEGSWNVVVHGPTDHPVIETLADEIKIKPEHVTALRTLFEHKLYKHVAQLETQRFRAIFYEQRAERRLRDYEKLKNRVKARMARILSPGRFKRNSWLPRIS